MSSEQKKTAFFFWFSLLFIVAVSSFDSYMSVKGQADLYEFELNPMARSLIALDGGEVSLLIGLKTFGTAIAVAACMFLRDRRYPHLNVVIAVLLIVQLGVLFSYSPMVLLF